MKSLFLLLLLCVGACAPQDDSYASADNQASEDRPSAHIQSADMSAYSKRLHAAKHSYPFTAWRAFYHNGLEQYTQQNCDAAQHIFDTLISDLIAAGEHAPEKQKVALFQKAIEATNELPAEMIETGEREQLCELTNVITVACGLQPENYGDGEGLASEWREW